MIRTTKLHTAAIKSHACVSRVVIKEGMQVLECNQLIAEEIWCCSPNLHAHCDDTRVWTDESGTTVCASDEPAFRAVRNSTSRLRPLSTRGSPPSCCVSLARLFCRHASCVISGPRSWKVFVDVVRVGIASARLTKPNQRVVLGSRGAATQSSRRGFS